MILTLEDRMKLNALAHGTGQEAVLYLANILYKFYAHEAVIAQGEAIGKHQGAAQLALWLKKLPEGLQNAANATS